MQHFRNMKIWRGLSDRTHMETFRDEYLDLCAYF